MCTDRRGKENDTDIKAVNVCAIFITQTYAKSQRERRHKVELKKCIGCTPHPPTQAAIKKSHQQRHYGKVRVEVFSTANIVQIHKTNLTPPPPYTYRRIHPLTHPPTHPPTYTIKIKIGITTVHPHTVQLKNKTKTAAGYGTSRL